MNPRYDFNGQVALVKGAAKGMGPMTARMFDDGGPSVVLCDLNGALCAEEVDEIVRGGGVAIGLACDVADEARSRGPSTGRVGLPVDGGFTAH